MSNTQSNARITTANEGRPASQWDASAPIPAPLALHATPVLPAWVDYNGHMSESCFLLVFGDNSDAFFRYFGIDEAYRAQGHSLYTVETRIHNLREASEGDPLALTLQLLDVDDKRLHIFHTMTNASTGDVLATAEQMLVHVDMAAGRSAPLPEHLRSRLEAIRAAHATLPRPATVGTVMGIRRKTT